MRLRLAVLGDPLTYTLSPDLHRAGLAALGLECESVALRTAPDALGARLDELAAAGYTGVNLTAPLKEAALEFAGDASRAARQARSVNTIGFARRGAPHESADGSARWGETTDGAGFVDLLTALGRSCPEQHAVLHGSGGASRSLALALREAGCPSVIVVSRDPESVAAGGAEFGATMVLADSREAAAAHSAATLVVNGTPRSSECEPVAPGDCAKAALLVDLTYGAEPTAWVAVARAAGREAIDGLGLLVHQARHSIQHWTGRPLGIEPLARAVGWPR